MSSAERRTLKIFLTRRFDRTTYKFEQERVFSQRSDAAGEPEDEHHTAHHQEEPDGVKAAEVRDGRDVGENALQRRREGLEAEVTPARCIPVEALIIMSSVHHTPSDNLTSFRVR